MDDSDGEEQQPIASDAEDSEGEERGASGYEGQFRRDTEDEERGDASKGYYDDEESEPEYEQQSVPSPPVAIAPKPVQRRPLASTADTTTTTSGATKRPAPLQGKSGAKRRVPRDLQTDGVGVQQLPPVHEGSNRLPPRVPTLSSSSSGRNGAALLPSKSKQSGNNAPARERGEVSVEYDPSDGDEPAPVVPTYQPRSPPYERPKKPKRPLKKPEPAADPKKPSSSKKPASNQPCKLVNRERSGADDALAIDNPIASRRNNSSLKRQNLGELRVLASSKEDAKSNAFSRQSSEEEVPPAVEVPPASKQPPAKKPPAKNYSTARLQKDFNSNLKRIQIESMLNGCLITAPETQFSCLSCSFQLGHRCRQVRHWTRPGEVEQNFRNITFDGNDRSKWTTCDICCSEARHLSCVPADKSTASGSLERVGAIEYWRCCYRNCRGVVWHTARSDKACKLVEGDHHSCSCGSFEIRHVHQRNVTTNTNEIPSDAGGET